MKKNIHQETHPEWFDDKGRPTPEILRALIDYDRKAGLMTWKERGPEYFHGHQGRVCFYTADMVAKSWNTRYAGNRALMSKWQKNGGKVMGGSVLGKPIYAHAAAFAIHYGRYAILLTARNDDMSDVSIKNLEETNHSSLAREGRFFSRSGSSIYKGVYYIPAKGKWKSTITFRSKEYFLGVFKSEHEAADAYDRAALKYFGPTAYTNDAIHPEPEPTPAQPTPEPINPSQTQSDDF